ncbi:hypothetical protein Ancab_039355 [Ancistrocladus abbreviatus]
MQHRTQYCVEFAQMAGSSSKNIVKVGDVLLQHHELSLFPAILFDVTWQTWNKVSFEVREFCFEDVRRQITNHVAEWKDALDGSILSVIARGGELNFLKAAVFGGVAHDPYEVKALVCLEAVQMAVTNGWKDVTFIGDYKVVLDSINSETEVPWKITYIVNKIQDLCSEFSEVSFHFLERQNNMSAYLLCGWVRKCKVKGKFFLRLLPYSISEAFAKEQISFLFRQ